MSEAVARPITQDAFLEWALDQEIRYEWVDGVPVAMAGARQQHDQIVGNLVGILFNALRGHRCRRFTADFAVRIPSGNVRRPDAGIDCAPFNRDALAAEAPVFVAEVLSPSTRIFDQFRKLEEYKSVPGLRYILLIDPDAPQASLWRRDRDDAWRLGTVEGLDAVITLTEPDIAIDLATLYEGTTFPPRPRLVVV